MVAKFNILGKQVGSHYLALLTLGSTFAIAKLAMGGGDKNQKPTPPIAASSGEEEEFIKQFLAQAEAESKPKAH
ncbi:hypothetical protein BDZ91DRAFT_730674 [Kalaharituber pfeilii]|nr:hypothetical protein BDZ91DRAFT_730674 [Kalaharituber pfeilii]